MTDHRIIETERLILRPPTLDDFEAFVAFQADAESMRFLGGVQPRALAWRNLMGLAGAWSLNGFAMFSVVEKASGRWVGRLGPWMPEGWPGTEVGWGVAREFAGRGYATEGAAAAMDWAFEHLGWTDIIHTIDPANAASIAVAKKLGARLLGPTRLPEPYQNERVDAWGQTREEWFARRKT
jgi:RimJ/RimL family protein N-acetyltransferase